MRKLILPPSLPLPDVSPALATGDTMYDGSDEHYVSVALSALRCVENALGTSPDPRSILDLPCGHGRVSRVLRARFPAAEMTACDLDRDGVDFVAANFGALPAYSVHDFRQLELGRTFDLIWVGSLVTHLSERQTKAFLGAMSRHMTPASVLVVSLHGPDIIPRLETWGYGLPREHALGLIADYEGSGFGYRDYPGGQGYGISLTNEEHLRDMLADGALKLETYSARAWDDHQDVAVLRLKAPAPVATRRNPIRRILNSLIAARNGVGRLG